MSSKVILLDVDGVLCNFVKPTLIFYNEKTGSSKTDDDIYDFNIFKSLGDAKMWGPFHNEVANHKLFCSNLEPYEYTKETIYGLKQLGELHIVTTPYETEFWHNERIEWLKQFGIEYGSINFVKNKHHYDGDILIDDCFANAQQWSKTRGKNSLLIERPWNKIEWSTHEHEKIILTKPEEIVESAEKVLFK